MVVRRIYLNFRVFSSNPGMVSAADRRLYAVAEANAVAHADVTLALSRADAASLQILGAREDHTHPSQPPCGVGVLNPPLRHDLVEYATSVEGGEKQERVWLLCCARLAPEKTIETFLELVETIGAARLDRLGVVPHLVGLLHPPPTIHPFSS